MKIIETINLTKKQKGCIFRLWNQEYPDKLKFQELADFDNYLNSLTEKKHFLLTNDSTESVGWALIFVRENEKWFAIILDSSIHGKGYGMLLLNKLKEKEKKLAAWVIDHNHDKKQNGEYYKSPLDFYLKHDFIIIPNIRLELDKISAAKIEWEKN